MKCVTCGKNYKAGDAICGFCGAMVGESRPRAAAQKPGAIPPPLPEKKSSSEPRPAPEPQWPSMDVEEVALPAEREPEQEDEAGPQRKPPAWVRFISPLFFIVLFLVTQFWLRDQEPSRPQRSEPPAASQPTLRQGGFVSELAEGRALETRTEFSLQSDQQVVFIGSWGGSSQGHSYSVEWNSPDGASHSSSTVSASATPDGDGFSLIATLKLEPSFAIGEWRVDVSQDGEVVSRYAFRLNE